MKRTGWVSGTFSQISSAVADKIWGTQFLSDPSCIFDPWKMKLLSP